MFEIINFPYNNRPVARLDSYNIVHNHLYHDCPVGRVYVNLIYDNLENIVGSVDNNGHVYSVESDSPIGKIDSNGFVYKKNKVIGKVNCDKNSCPNLAGGAYLILIYDKR